ncbi:DNA-directed RNA polymerase subunit beta [Candidatus Uhrbacteria bacterium CG_4_9_14_3_um_filter_41_35]|uniref:DNA-directed RNA polymerase subunit beta n=1 Tax=Candidatus Uhrbacteria bacterium CG_4_9_14_3_um_filter_41_35 TaxID=1975034 RepID=A0A2M7XGQ9_9BACT|nr:MAG: DNA-directed RNA polymerase subunit beta [Candidatus Uhrbacteria bacterium CG11_big_fil_rev_8_21_14_0_20_41_9]PJA47039.1 MAG: DNA-directed RNA polymerase subunit beta [Candidatus Uhrbacteria bacterium CG_4_9_14_3_um_filter_41_35]
MAQKTEKTVQPRKFFTKNRPAMDLPELIEIQKASYDWFLKEGIRDLFHEISPISDFIGRDLELTFEDYYIDEPKFDETTSKFKNITYEAPLRVKAKLTNNRTKESKEQEIFLGDIPVMTPRGTFIVNGIERVIVSQLVRSAGAFFTAEVVRGRRQYGAKIIPNRGAWLEFETDGKNVIWVKIDRKRKVAVTSLMRAFGFSSDEEILPLFADIDTHPLNKYIEATLAKDSASNEEEGLKEVYKRIRPGDLATADNARQLIHSMFFNFDRYDLGPVGRYKFNLRFGKDNPEEGVQDEPNRILSKEDLVEIIREIIRLNNYQEEPDDVDHLGNRRIRAVGELIQGRFRIGLARMERIVRDRMSTHDIESLSPGKLINARPVIGSTREFFMSSQLSQFMDQINPLSELEHKRRLSAMGQGGLSRERAGFEVRDVHTTHYGRICPVQTSEGPNIGLIGHLASYARINKYGFIETPYRKVVIENGRAKVTNDIEYLNAFKEEKSITVPATAPVDDDGYIIAEFVEARKYGEAKSVAVTEVNYMDVSPGQIVSIATSLIPFLEHDDSTRALMGSNMQRQAVPTIRPRAPIVGTGMERRAALDSGHVLVADADGEVTLVNSGKVVVNYEKEGEVIYDLNKFIRSNASTAINQRPVVVPGMKVKKGDVLADGPSVQNGELALGQNMMVCFMSWDGYNYDDAVIVNERVVQDDRFTTIHLENLILNVRDTKLGPEVITSDIPNVSEEKLKHLDNEGIIRVGAEVHSGDILVGKITPKGETELSAEEKLLRAIFGEKARDVRDSSLYLQHGHKGKVVGIKIFSREDGDNLPPGVIRSIQVTVADLRKLQVGDKVAGRHGNKGVISKIVPVEDMPFTEGGRTADIILTPLGVVSRMNLGQILEVHLGLAAHKLGYTAAAPVFDGVDEEDIQKELVKAGYPKTGQLTLFDGRTGEAFHHPVTMGVMYMIKLNHMVEDKMHQRSIGPYSLITQQPLGGKAQFGGQRFGEMEVWALEAYGAAHTLQEILTIKSDDISGRSKAYESIIKGEEITKVNIPESFNVLVREMKGLCLDVELLDNGKKIELSGEHGNSKQ